MKLRYWAVLSLSMTLIGCGGSADNADSGGGEEEGVFDPMVGTIDRAKGVEDMNMGRKEEMDRAIEDLEE